MSSWRRTGRGAGKGGTAVVAGVAVVVVVVVVVMVAEAVILRVPLSVMGSMPVPLPMPMPLLLLLPLLPVPVPMGSPRVAPGAASVFWISAPGTVSPCGRRCRRVCLRKAAGWSCCSGASTSPATHRRPLLLGCGGGGAGTAGAVRTARD